MPDESQIKVGDTIGGFQILEKIAEGGMGTVFKARQLSLDRIVAIKILPPRLASDEQFVRHFQEESRVAARLKHPHLIEVYDAGKSDGIHFFVMEYVEGETVGERMRRDGPFGEQVAVGICLNVAQALQHAWEKAKLIHGDIKPENLILERESKKVRVGDLGLGKSLLDRTELDAAADQRHAMGTPAYVCPEQARGDKHLDFRADMYALGATFYQMLTGQVPFEGMNPVDTLAGHLKGTLPDPRKLRPGISEATIVVLERMMAKEPDLRYPSWAALAHDLEQVHHGRTPSVPPLPAGRSTIARETAVATPPSAPARKPTSSITARAVLVLIVVLLSYLFFYSRSHRQPTGASAPHTTTIAVTTSVRPAPAPTELTRTGAVANLTVTNTVPPASRAVSEPVGEKTAPEVPLPAEAEAKARIEADNRYTAWRTTFEAMLARGDYTKARDAASAARSEVPFAPVKDKLARDLRMAQMILGLREAARTNLLGQTYYVGSTPGTVVRIEADKFWVKLAAGEIAVPFDSVEPTKIPTMALSKNRNDPDLNLAAALFCWYRTERDIAKTYFDAAAKAGADVTPYLPLELVSPAPGPTPPPEAPSKGNSETNSPARSKPALPPDDGLNMLSNHSFERWSGKMLLDWSTSSSQARPVQDKANVVDGESCVRFDFGPNQPSMLLEQLFHAAGGHKYRLQFFYRTEGFEGQLWAEIGSPGDPIPKLKNALTDNSEWQAVTIDFDTANDASLLVRIRASKASGTLWLDHFDLRPF